MESSVMDQLRLQEGRLFQSESILALYLDLKAVVNEMLARALKDPKVKESMDSFDDDFCQSCVELLLLLSPKGIKDYHSQSLFECAKTTARLLWPSENLLIARPQMSALFQGLFKRICKNDAFSYYFSLDPIKQDFVVREAFRRTIVNDCLTVFEASVGDNNLKDLEKVGPDDSDSKMLYPDGIDESDAKSIVARSVALSVIHNKAECTEEVVNGSFNHSLDEEVGPDDSASQMKIETKSCVTKVDASLASVANNAVSQKVYDDIISIGTRTKLTVAPSVMPKIVSSENKVSSDIKSTVASSIVSSSSMRKPLNVRKIVLEIDPKQQ